MKIGIDFGGVLSVTDISGAEHRNVLINMPNAIDCIQQLFNAGHVLYLISFCGSKRAFETRDSIDRHGLTSMFTGQYYVKKKEYKGNICKKLGIQCMIDDSVDVLNSIILKNPGIHTILFNVGWLDVMKKLMNVIYTEVECVDCDVGRLCYLIV